MSSPTVQQFQPLSPETLGNETVSLYVGSKRKEFTIHKKLLCDQSDFFKSAFTTGFKETKEGVMYLPNDEPNAIQNLVNYLYRGSIPQKEENTVKLRLFYILAEKICMENLMDRIMNEICSVMKKERLHFRGTVIRHTYGHTNDNSKLRLLCAANAVCSIGHQKKYDWIADSSDIFSSCPEFFRDFFNFQAKYLPVIPRKKRGNLINISDFNYCEFHTHKKEDDCPLKLSKFSDN